MVTVSCRVLVLAVALTLTATSGLAQTAKDVGRQHKSSMLHFLAASSPVSQNKNPSQGTEDGRSLPNITILMHEVAEQQKAAEAIEKDYLYHAIDIVQEVDRHGKVKRAVTKEYDVFWLEGVPVHKLTRKDGRTLSPEEQKKQSEEIDRQVTKVREKRAKASAKGKETDPAGDETITVSRLLELGRFTNPRRVNLNGRDTIAVDFAGDPKAKTRNRAENVIRDMAGTVWVDEKDCALVKVEGQFLNSFKIGGGLVVNIQKGTNFSMEKRKVNNEVWLPTQVEGHGAARALLLFNFKGSFREIDSDYRKFKATFKILPGMTAVGAHDE